MRLALSPARLGSSFWTVTDQGVVSLGNFFTNWMLAKYLLPVEYGTFGLLFGILLFANSIHSSLVTVPLGVEGAASEAGDLKLLTGYAVVFGIVLTVPIGLVCASACLFLHRLDLMGPVIAAMLLWFTQETLRRALMAHLRHRDALWGDALSYLGQAIAVVGLHRAGSLSPAAAFVAMAATSAAAALVQVFQSGIAAPAWGLLKLRALKFWSLGRWVLFGNLVNVLTVQAFPWSLAVFRGLQQAAALQAIANLLGVSHPLIFGIGNLIVPASARAMAESGVAAAKRAAFSYGSQGALLLGPYLLALFLFPRTALGLFYGQASPYVTLDVGLRIFVVVYALVYLAQVLSSLFNGISRSQFGFLAYLAGGLIALCPGFPLVARAGMAGAFAALLCSYAVRGAVCVYYYRRTA